MPPSKARVVQEDSKTEAVFAKDKHPAANNFGSSRGKRNGHSNLVNGTSAKDFTTAAVDPSVAANGTGAQSLQTASGSGIQWNNENTTLLQSYRNSYHLDTPTAFQNPLSHVILNQGIGKYSPTMARKKGKRRISKDQLALNVRKNFNALAVSENEVIVDLLYKVRSQDKEFRVRFAPPRTR